MSRSLRSEPTLNNIGEKVLLYPPGLSNKPNVVVKVLRLTKTLAICVPIGALWSGCREYRLKRDRYKPAPQDAVEEALQRFASVKLQRQREEQARKDRESDPHWQAAHRVSNQTEWSILSLEQLQTIIKWLDEAALKKES